MILKANKQKVLMGTPQDGGPFGEGRVFADRLV